MSGLSIRLTQYIDRIYSTTAKIGIGERPIWKINFPFLYSFFFIGNTPFLCGKTKWLDFLRMQEFGA